MCFRRSRIVHILTCVSPCQVVSNHINRCTTTSTCAGCSRKQGSSRRLVMYVTCLQCHLIVLTLSALWQDKAEAKLQMLEQKAQEQQKARLAADEEWRHQQRERELARLKVCTPSLPSSPVACFLQSCKSRIAAPTTCLPLYQPGLHPKLRVAPPVPCLSITGTSAISIIDSRNDPLVLST